MRRRTLILVPGLAAVVAAVVVVALLRSRTATRIPPSELTLISASEALEGSARLVSVEKGKYRVNFTLRNKSRKAVSLDVCFSQPLICVEIKGDGRWRIMSLPGAGGLALPSDWPLWEYYELGPGESVLSEISFVPDSWGQPYIAEGAPMAVHVGFDGGTVHGEMRIPFSARLAGSEDTSVGEVQYSEEFSELWSRTSPMSDSSSAVEMDEDARQFDRTGGRQE